jgi:hypothetical protein
MPELTWNLITQRSQVQILPAQREKAQVRRGASAAPLFSFLASQKPGGLTDAAARETAGQRVAGSATTFWTKTQQSPSPFAQAIPQAEKSQLRDVGFSVPPRSKSCV